MIAFLKKFIGRRYWDAMKDHQKEEDSGEQPLSPEKLEVLEKVRQLSDRLQVEMDIFYGRDRRDGLSRPSH